MKRLILTLNVLILVTLSQTAFAQSPGMFSYQAVLRDAGGALIRNTEVGMRIGILQGSPEGAEVYVEEYTVTTNANGLITLKIGSASQGGETKSVKSDNGYSSTLVGGDLSSIDWSDGPYFLKVETDPEGGTNYTITGVSQLLSVPYAMYSKTAEGISGNLSIKSNSDVNTALGSGAFNIQNIDKTLGLHFDANEIQTIGTDLFINQDNEQTTHINNFVHITPRHKVGIGTDNPSALLHIVTDTSTTLIISSKNSNDPERPGIQFKNNSSQFISGDDDSNEIFGFYSKWGSIRSYDAKLRVYGKASGSWGKYVEITHDGKNAHITTDEGDIEIAPAGETKIKNLIDPVEDKDAATKKYVDQVSGKKYEIGDFAQGGIVFWVDETGEHGLVCNKKNMTNVQLRWSAGTDIHTMAYGNGPGSGEMNTSIIIAKQGYGDGSTYAALECSKMMVTEDGSSYGDWYLPSKEELLIIAQNKAVIDATATTHGGEELLNGYYYSSTEYNDKIVWVVDITHKTTTTYNKYIGWAVRAVRAF